MRNPKSEIGNKNRKKGTSKFIREYGMTLQQLSDKYDMKTGYLYILHQRGELHDFIDEQEAKQQAPVGAEL